MRICRNLMLIAALTFTLWVLPDGSQARMRKCAPPTEILNYCKHVMCPLNSAGSFCVRRCVWNVTAGDCWSTELKSKNVRYWPLAGIYSSRGSKAAADAGEVAVASDTEGLK
jgi:hypothetical protein